MLKSLPGLTVDVRIEGRFFNNFLVQKCVGATIQDPNGVYLDLNTFPEFRADATMTLPLTIGYVNPCFTSPMNVDLKENKASDVDFTVTISLVL
jgi:hypothetical protein